MKTLKLIGVAALALATVIITPEKSDAQTYGVGGNILTSQVYLLGTTNLASPQSFFVGDRRNVGFQWTIYAGANGTTNIANFAYSDDGISYDTNSADLYSITNIQGSAGPVTKVYNVDTVGHGYLELVSFTQGSATSTNTLKRSIKISAP